MKTKYILTLATILILISCGKSEKEIRIEKEIEKKKIELQKIHEQKVNIGKRKRITELTIKLQRIPEIINKIEEDIKDINVFQIGRLQSTKNKQLNRLSFVINLSETAKAVSYFLTRMKKCESM